MEDVHRLVGLWHDGPTMVHRGGTRRSPPGEGEGQLDGLGGCRGWAGGDQAS